jgi:hypothetical protein
MKPVAGARVRFEIVEHSDPDWNAPGPQEIVLGCDLKAGKNSIQDDDGFMIVESFRQLGDCEWGVRMLAHKPWPSECHCCGADVPPLYATCRLTVLAEPQR